MVKMTREEKPSDGLATITFGPPDDPRKWVRYANIMAARILDGTYPAGEWMPSMGRIGAEFRAGWETVKEAFEALSAKGLITSAGKSGYYVGNGLPPQISRQRSAAIARLSRTGPAGPGEENSTLLSEKYLTVREIAVMLRLAYMTVYRVVKSGDIEGAIRVGNSYRIPESGVQAYLRSAALSRTDQEQMPSDSVR